MTSNQVLAKPAIAVGPPEAWLWAIPIALAAALIFINPVGFVGGGADDGRYLAAAQCWLANGPCLPTNHWEGRWPVVAPLAMSIELFGFNRTAIAIPALAAGIGCLALLKFIGDRLFGAPAGLAAALIFALMPAFAMRVFSSTAEPIELLFVLAGFAFVLSKRALLGGLCLALAFQTRETALVTLAPAILLCWKDRRSLATLCLGFGAPLLIEFAAFQFLTGDPFYRRELSLAHTTIPSSSLKRPDHRLPLFNTDLLRNWPYSPGLRIHWTVDGFANLVVNMKTGFLFAIAPLMYLATRLKLPAGDRAKVTALLVGAFFYAAVLIYVLAVNPAPRIMWTPLAALATVVGAIAVRFWGPVIATALGSIAVLSALCVMAQPRSLAFERAAEYWVRTYPGKVATPIAYYFIFSPELQALPASGRPLVIKLDHTGCPNAVARQPNNRLAALLGDKTSMCLVADTERL